MGLDFFDASSVPVMRDTVEVCMTRAGFGGATRCRDPRVALVPRSHALRAGTEACIRDVYRRVFGVSELVLPRMLIAWMDDDGPLCAAGLRTVADGFFSEVYLDAPIESLLAELSGKPVPRHSIVEITTLASQSSQISTAFLRQLALYAKRAGFGWALFTATAGLRNLLFALGIPTLVLEAADPRRLSSPEQWGSYYEQDPRVCAVDHQWLFGSPIHKGKSLRDA